MVGDGKSAASDAQPAAAAPAADALLTVAFVVAKPAPFDRRITMSGQTEADKQMVLVARTSGVVARLAVAQGSALAADDLVMALDGPEKLAAVVSAQAQFDTATHQADTNQQLRAKGSLSVPQLETSVAAREATRSALESAKAEGDRLDVRAPFAGVVDTVLVGVGSWVQPGPAGSLGCHADLSDQGRDCQCGGQDPRRHVGRDRVARDHRPRRGAAPVGDHAECRRCAGRAGG